ncbi:MAG TPA: HNH endonuclease signature motif containing protein [Solirubrobacteraceae bacterium]|nr:HNH endonuclease signature motif containing protein [Solirubrobacteraceae bacterium]
MLREAANATIVRRLTLLGRRYELRIGQRPAGRAWRARAFARLMEAQRHEPVAALTTGAGRTYWLFEDAWYWSPTHPDQALEPRDVLALVRERRRRRQRALERAHAGLAAETAGDGTARREPIPRAVRQAVFERDGGRCVECGATFDLQYDHVIPLALGGASTAENLQVLCAECNRRKGAALA